MPPPAGEVSRQGAVPFPRFCFNFWFEMGQFLFNKFFHSCKRGHRPVPPPLKYTTEVNPDTRPTVKVLRLILDK